LIPADSTVWEFAAFDDFAEARNALIAKKFSWLLLNQSVASTS
jgi:hypothetical protein